jgi:superfamily II DNA/RNA helicase
MPNDIETYIHRIGRSGRAGSLGKSITFTTPEEIPDLLRIENFVKVKIEKKKYVNGEFLAVSPDEISVKNVIIPRWSRGERFRGGFSRSGFNRRSTNRGFRDRRFRTRRYR